MSFDCFWQVLLAPPPQADFMSMSLNVSVFKIKEKCKLKRYLGGMTGESNFVYSLQRLKFFLPSLLWKFKHGGGGRGLKNCGLL